MNEKPKRCIDPIMKSCEMCIWGWKNYPDWVESYNDLSYCNIESGCTLGYDQGRPEDEPTEEEMKKFDEWMKTKEGMIYTIEDKFNPS